MQQYLKVYMTSDVSDVNLTSDDLHLQNKQSSVAAFIPWFSDGFRSLIANDSLKARILQSSDLPIIFVFSLTVWI